MKKERWKQIDDVFDEAIDLPIDEREEFLSNKCEGDPKLKAHVLRLLKSEKDAESFMQKPVINLMAEAIADEQPTLLDSIGFGKKIGNYRIEGTLGKGGMGEVFLAHDSKLNRKVALKVLPREFIADAERIQRFEAEARAISVLNHPNIVTIHDFGNDGDVNFIATELVLGKTVRELINTGLTIEESISIVRQVSDALSAAHKAGIIHRDIKPENIMVHPDGYVKVLDFGLVKLAESHEGEMFDLAKTIKGTIMGTPAYMSPDQASGAKVDNRTDLWSLGVVLYEMLTGENPFKQETRKATLHAILSDNLVPPSTINSKIPSELDQILIKTLEKDRDLSYQTSSGFSVDLKRVKRGIDSSPSSSGDNSGITQKRSWDKPAALAIAITGLITLGVGIWFTFSHFRATNPWKSARNIQLTETSGLKLFPSFAPDGKSFVYTILTEKNLEIFWQRVGGKNAVNLSKSPETDDSMATFSPDGKLIAFRSDRKPAGIYLMESTGENVRRISDFASHPSWSPDGKKIVVSSEYSSVHTAHTIPSSSLWIIDVETSEKRKLETRGDAIFPQWSPNGDRIAFWFVKDGKLGDIATIPVEGGEPVVVAPSDASDWNPVWAPDGKHLYFVSDRNGNMSMWRIQIDEKTGKTLSSAELIPTPSKYSRHIAFSRSGRRLAYVRNENKSNLQSLAFDPDKEEVSETPNWITRGNIEISMPDLSPDGENFVLRVPNLIQEDLVIYGRDGTRKRFLTKNRFNERSPRWSPDGKTIYFHSNQTGKYQIWSINPDGTNLKQISFSNGLGATNAVISPDGSKLIYTELRGADGIPFILDLTKSWQEQTPKQLFSKSLDSGNRFYARSWSLDGNKILFTAPDQRTKKNAIGIFDLKSNLFKKTPFIGDSPDWLNDSKRIIFGSYYEIFLGDSQTGRFKSLHKKTRYQIANTNISKDNKQIFYRFMEAEAEIWLLDSSNGDGS